MTTIDITCPAGTYGLAVEPWSKGEIYAVAADWAQASAPVYSYGKDGWCQIGQQVADYQHRVKDALRAQLVETIALSEGIPSDEVDEDDIDAILSDAVDIDDASEDE